MPNVTRNHDAQVEQDIIGRLAEVIGMLIEAGVLQWSAHAAKPVTREARRGGLENNIEEWLRNG